MNRGAANSPQPTYWQELLIQILRLSGRVGVQLMRLSLSDMKDLLGVALARELLDRGYRTADICVAVGVSRTTVKKYLRLSKQLGSLDLQPEALRLAVMRLQDGRVSVEQLRRRLPVGDEFDTAEVAVNLLLSRGLADRQGEGDAVTYGLTEAALKLDDPDWEAPLAEMAQHYWLGRDVLRVVAQQREVSEAELRRDPRVSRGEDHLEATLAFLVQLGYLKVDGGALKRYRLADGHLKLIPEEERARRRVGLLDLVEKTGVFLETMLAKDEHDPIGQRSFEFIARPEAVRAFLKDHRAWVVERLEQMEAEANAAGDGREFMMVWAVSPSDPEPPRQG